MRSGTVVLCGGVFQEAEVLDDRGLLRLALADAEEADDLHHENDEGADTGGDPAEERDDRADDGHEDRGDADLQALADVEHRVRRGRRGEKRDDDADEAHQIREHREDLVVGNVPRVEFGGVIGGIIRRLSLGNLLGNDLQRASALAADIGGVIVCQMAVRAKLHVGYLPLM